MSEASWRGQQPRIRLAQVGDLESVARLFDAYRQFYGQPSALATAQAFLRARFERQESVLLVAQTGTGLCGFTQLYPTFCSVAAASIFVLYDLYVEPAARRHGVARALLRAACAHAQGCGAARVELATARTNAPAQALYESEGWVRDEVFYRYGLETPH